MLSAYPTKRSRLGNAVGLDTPASVICLLEALRSSGYRIDRIPASGDELMSELAETFSYDREAVVAHEARCEVGRLTEEAYCSWFSGLPAGLRLSVGQHWGRPPGTVQTATGRTAESRTDLVFSGLDLGGVLVCVQPPRGFGENPVAVYHSPDLPPTHHYLGFYRWLDDTWGAMAIVHVGKHGNLEWLPGKGVGLSAECGPDAALGSIPLVYPFVVNDPGEGAQAKRRAHAVIVDHLVPPLTRAETYDDLATLEGLLDEHARVSSLDPDKLPSIRRKVWDCLVAAEIHRDLGLDAAGDAHARAFDDPAFDDLLVEVDGYLCELKDAQIRGGLHILGRAPQGDAELDMVLAITRLNQGHVPSLRQAVARMLGVSLEQSRAPGHRQLLERVEEECRRLVGSCQRDGWVFGPVTAPCGAVAISDEVASVLSWVCGRLVPALHETSGEVPAVAHFLDGGFVPPGPSGAPSAARRMCYRPDATSTPSTLERCLRGWPGRSDVLSGTDWWSATWPKRAGLPGRSGWSYGGRLRCGRPGTT